MNKIKDNLGIYFLFMLGILVLYGIINTYVNIKPDMDKNGVWVICKTYDTKVGGKGGNLNILFKYYFREKEYVGVQNAGGRANKILNKRYLIKISSKTPSLFYFTEDNPVPDSIKSAPPEGWKELPTWAKQNR